MAKVLSNEDGNLSSSIRLSREVAYKDIDLTLERFDDTGDIYRKNDAAAVKQSVKNLLLCGRYRKPFDMNYGAGLEDLLFDLSYGHSELEINDRIRSAIARYEPRAKVRSIIANVNDAANSIRVRVEFDILNLSVTEVLETNISKLR
jgi:phage baseplate assembly protein W